MSLLADYNMPFAVAFGIMLVLALLQITGLGDLFGEGDIDGAGDIDIDLEPDGASGVGALDGFFRLLGFRHLPVSVWLMMFLFAFAGIGVSIQSFAEGLTGGVLDPLLASLFAGAAALPVTGIVARPLGYIMPKDETTAVSVQTLVGRRARILDGTAKAASPARAKVHDHFGQSHNVMVEPHDQSEELQAGETVLLVRREGATFYASRLTEPRLAPSR